MKILGFIFMFIGFVYTQCDQLNEIDCSHPINGQGCEWIENITYNSCSSLGTGNPSFCDSQPECSYSWLTYSCSGGSYQVDDSYCQESEVLECSEFDELDCNSNNSCNWVEQIESGYCGSHNSSSSCPDWPLCSWSCDGCWYLGECCGSYICSGGYYEQDESYCEEEVAVVCSELSQNSCNHPFYGSGCSWISDIESGTCNGNSLSECNADENCNWVNDYDWASCNDLGSSACDANPNCWGAYTNPGWYYGWYCAGGSYQIDTSYCSGGDYEVDNGFCQESDFMLADMNYDSTVNVLDVIQIVNLILNNEFSLIGDTNYDNELNVLDVVLVLDMILFG